MQFSPFMHMRKRALGKIAVDSTRLDLHRNFKLTIDRMKMSRPVITIVHGDDNAKKAGSAQA
jgi:hypothetical protein